MPRRGGCPVLLALVLVASCQVVGSNVHNLKEVHDVDGSPKRKGSVQGDLEYVLRSLTKQMQIAGAKFPEPPAGKIKDPVGVCLDNLIELTDFNPSDPGVLALQIENCAWIGTECTWELSRERAALALGALASLVGAEGPAEMPSPALGAEEVGKLLEGLLRAARPVIRRDGGESELASAVAGIRAASLDVKGARRLLAATNLLITGSGRARTDLAALAELERDLERRSLAMAIFALARDPQGLVRAAGLEAAVIASRNRVSDLLRAGLADREEVVAQRAFQLVATHGLPEAPPGADAEEWQRGWIDALIGALDRHLDDAATVAGCHALARATGDPENLRPETWVARYLPAARALVPEGTR